MGLTYRGTSIQTANIMLDIHKGYAEPAEVRGEDLVIPGKHGRTHMTRKKDFRSIELRGWVKGTGATLLARQQSWRAQTDVLMALMDHTLADAALVVSPDTLGVAVARTITAKCVNVLPGPIEAGMTFQRWTIELRAIGDPPDWANV